MFFRANVGGGLIFLALALVASGGPAPDDPGGKESIPTSASAGPAPVPTSRARSKPSAQLARDITSLLPRWHPPPPEPEKAPLPPDPGVIRMKPFVVRGERVRLTDADVLTGAARVKAAEKKYLSPAYRRTFGPLSQIAGYFANFLSILHGWHPNAAEAATLLHQEERLKMLNEMDEFTRIEALGGNAADVKELRRLRYEAAAASR